jgi:hypothetical protein
MTYSGGTSSGTLTVTNGADTTSINLIGDYTIGNFKSASDGSGGTLIYDPPIVSAGGAVTNSDGSPGTSAAMGENFDGSERMAIFASSDVWRDQTLVGSPSKVNSEAIAPQSTELSGAFLGYMAGLSDSKQFASAPGGMSGENLAFVTSAAISPVAVNYHHQ